MHTLRNPFVDADNTTMKKRRKKSALMKHFSDRRETNKHKEIYSIPGSDEAL